MFCPFAVNSSCVAASRTWPMLPGADWNLSENTVCIESTMTSAGLMRAISSRIRSRQVSARRYSGAVPTASRSPRDLIWCSDSSPEL